MVGFRDYEDDWYSREATSLRNNTKWRTGRQKLMNLDWKLRQIDLVTRKHHEIELHNFVKPTNYALNQTNINIRRNWNRKFPIWAAYRELHMGDLRRSYRPRYHWLEPRF